MKGEAPRFPDPGWSRWQSSLLLATGFVFVAVFLFAVTVRYAAYRQSEKIDGVHLARAVRWDPQNAEYQARLGHWRLYVDNNPRAAAQSYETATRLNPYEARYWLALATARLQLSDSSGEIEAIRNAAAAAPTTPDIVWNSGMHLMVDGRDREALQTFRNLLISAPGEVNRVVSLSWRALHDSQRILNEALPRDAAAYLTLQRVLLESGAYDDADKVWNATVALGQQIPPPAAILYIDDLLRRQRVDAAASTWQYLIEHDAGLRGYRRENNLVMNSTFEEPLLNDAFDWRFPSAGPVEFSLDSNETHSGTGSLLLNFQGDMVGETGLYQLIPVLPDTEYSVRATIKSSELVSAAPLRLQASDAYDAVQVLGTTNGVIGTTGDWIEVTGKIRTGPKTHLAKLAIVHAENSHVAGKLWIDSVEMKPVGPNANSR